jgi:hypothetical protein
MVDFSNFFQAQFGGFEKVGAAKISGLVLMAQGAKCPEFTGLPHKR